MDHFWSGLLTGPQGPRPSGRAIEAEVRSAILSGRLKPQTRMPSSRRLAHELGVARGTVVDAYAQLVGEGWLLAKAGSGTSVAPAGEAVVPADARLRNSRPVPGIDLRPTANDTAGFPQNAWLRASRRAMQEYDFASVEHRDPRGSPTLRAELCRHLARTRGVHADPDNVIVTTGFIQGLGLIAQVLARQGRTCLAVEDPSFPILRDVAVAHGQQLLGIPVDADGMATDLLDSVTAAAARVVMLSPSRQFPLGSNLSPQRRAHVLTWAQANDGYVIEDDFDGEYRFDRRPLGSLQGHAPERVIYAGTTSKTLGFGLRLGWIVAPSALLPELMRAKQLADGFTGVLQQATLLQMLRDGSYTRHVRRRRNTFRQRRDLLCEALADGAPWISLSGVAAGLTAVLRFPEEIDEDAVLDVLAEHGLILTGLRREGYWMNPTPRPATLLLNFALPSEASFRRGVDILTSTLREAGGRDGLAALERAPREPRLVEALQRSALH